MKTFLSILSFCVGYGVAVYTWDKIHAWIIGAEDKALALRDKAREIEKTLRG